MTTLPAAAARATPPAATAPLPKGPVLGWRSLAGAQAAALPWVGSLPACVPTTSGRAALYQALRALQLRPGQTVLVPSYHCPTMVAPVVCAGLEPSFVAVGPDGLPRLDLVSRAQRETAGAIVVAHYFGVVRNLDDVRRWCDEHGIALIEDCAHALFGAASGTPVGRWGDYCTASIAKFLPVSEMGLLASARRPVAWQGQAPGARAQLKGAVDIFEQACRHGRPAVLAPLLRGLFHLKNRGLHPARLAAGEPPPSRPGEDTPSTAQMLADCDMARIEQAPVLAARLIHGFLPRGRLVARRQRNFDLYAQFLHGLEGTHPLVPARPAESAPYVYPLWVDDADRVYHALRLLGMPVFRWDRVWPGTPALAGDVGPQWSRHVLQLLCHQDLSSADIGRVVDQLRTAVGHPAPRAPHP